LEGIVGEQLNQFDCEVLRGDRISVVGDGLYTSARYARRWWWGGGASQAEPDASARGHLADRTLVSISVSSLLRQIDNKTVASIHSMHTCLLRATRGCKE
jgi:hypothetical protein